MMIMIIFDYRHSVSFAGDNCVRACLLEAIMSDINEDRLCYEESLLRDDWLWTGKYSQR